MGKRQNLAGKKYGRLTAVRESGFIFYGKRRHAVWHCRCDCGGSTDANVMMLRLGHKRSCGCLVTEKQIASRTHGQSRCDNGNATKEYRAYRAMLNRCYRPADIEYRNYGARGITVCESWRAGFQNFFADMGKSPSPTHSLDRINCDGNYEPSNCKWSTAREQSLNRRNTIIYDGKPLIELGREAGIHYRTLFDRWQQGDRGPRLLRPVRGHCNG